MESLEPKIFRQPSPFPQTINMKRYSIHQASEAIQYLLQDQNLSTSIVPIGAACHTANKGNIDFMSLSSTTTAILIFFDKTNTRSLPKDTLALLSAGGGDVPAIQSRCCLVGFSMGHSAIQISKATKLQVKAVDVAHISPALKSSPPVEIVKEMSFPIDMWRTSRLWSGNNQWSKTDTCLQAWLAACVGTKYIAGLKGSGKVNTAFLNANEVDCLSRLVSQSDLHNRHQPKEFCNEFSLAISTNDGKVKVQNSRYKTRIRPGNESRVIMNDAEGHSHIGYATRSKGKETIIKTNGSFPKAGNIHEIKVQGRQDLTNSEKARDELIDMLLTGKASLRRSFFIRAIWFPKWNKIPHGSISIVNPGKVTTTLDCMNLNKSQQKVARAMCHGAPIVIVHGPPGTGKTTTISATSRIWGEHNFAVWIVAHSNVAVKNIAESLSKKDVKYKLIVSKEFYAEWHEHLYTGVEHNLIRSDELPENKLDMERLLGGARIILCTLSMISCPALRDNRTFEIVPMERLIIDESSQINIFEFMTVFERFTKTLGKVCFFGDPKQLPPYGKDEIPSIETIFDVKHLSKCKADFFLDTQYRMPVPIGKFLSSRIYGGRLKSVHTITGNQCVAFVDVPISRGDEKMVGKSFKNDAEVQSVVHVVKLYYRLVNFCVITPYDPQRAAIQTALKAENLPSDSVFAVDSFQGNEADYIIISTVRTRKPGFLISLNRMNVMLSRCKKGMVIIASRDFLKAKGSTTLLGVLAKQWEEQDGESKVWRDWRTVADGVADLPGALGPNRNRRKS